MAPRPIFVKVQSSPELEDAGLCIFLFLHLYIYIIKFEATTWGIYRDKLGKSWIAILYESSGRASFGQPM